MVRTDIRRTVHVVALVLILLVALALAVDFYFWLNPTADPTPFQAEFSFDETGDGIEVSLDPPPVTRSEYYFVEIETEGTVLWYGYRTSERVVETGSERWSNMTTERRWSGSVGVDVRMLTNESSVTLEHHKLSENDVIRVVGENERATGLTGLRNGYSLREGTEVRAEHEVGEVEPPENGSRVSVVAG